MFNNKIALSLLAVPVALSLSGCGDSGNAHFDKEHRFWGDEVDYSKSRLFHIEKTEGTLFDTELAEKFNLLGMSGDFQYAPSSQEDLEKALANFESIRDALDSLPVSDELKAAYLADLEEIEEITPKIAELNINKYNGVLDTAYRELHSEQFERVDVARAKIEEKNNFLFETGSKKADLEAEVKAKKDELRELAEEHEQKASDWVVENEILISVQDFSFTAHTDNSYYYGSEAECRELIADGNSNYYWNSEAEVCYRFWVMYDNIGLDKRHHGSMTEEQLAEYKTMTSELFDESHAVGIKLSGVQKQLDEAKEAHKKRELLANNRFGEQRTLDRELSSAISSLNSATNGAYGRDGKLDVPREGRYSPRQDSVFNDYKKKLGLYELPEVTAFNPDNAYEVYKAIVEATEAAAIDIEMSSNGGFNVEPEAPFEKLFVVAKTDDKTQIQPIKLNKREDKFVVSTGYGQSVQGETLLALYKTHDDWNPNFRGAPNYSHNDLNGYVRFGLK